MNLFKNRKFKYGSAAVGLTCVAVALIVIVNVIFSALSDRYRWYVDMTKEKIYGISDSSIALLDSYKDEPELFRNLNEKISEFEPEFITVYFGSDVEEAEAESMADILREAFPDAEISAVNGGQPVYYYMISVE